MKLNTYTATVELRVEARTLAYAKAQISEILNDVVELDSAKELIDIYQIDLIQTDDHNEGGLQIGFTF